MNTFEQRRLIAVENALGIKPGLKNAPPNNLKKLNTEVVGLRSRVGVLEKVRQVQIGINAADKKEIAGLKKQIKALKVKPKVKKPAKKSRWSSWRRR